jgi:hypothetical protein
VEAVIGQDALEDEAGAGGFIAGTDRAVIGQAAEEPTHLHQVGGKCDNFGLLTGPLQDRSGDGVGMHVETNNRFLDHGWTPFPDY